MIFYWEWSKYVYGKSTEEGTLQSMCSMTSPQENGKSSPIQAVDEPPRQHDFNWLIAQITGLTM